MDFGKKPCPDGAISPDLIKLGQIYRRDHKGVKRDFGIGSAPIQLSGIWRIARLPPGTDLRDVNTWLRIHGVLYWGQEMRIAYIYAPGERKFTLSPFLPGAGI